ncbi:MAG TPA: ATPase, T2SS/T4P/T4SS family [Deltaproteobacteria bacterium]|nr:ATPase, T2SS/T4P/T4SS family [Deltaproteobacteria bacterium]HOI07106.1 ATPase, T2SS/T4P/T4SS family [Deltaproteobacteria bacterium]
MADNRRMGEILVELGLIDEYRLRHALEVAKKENCKLGETLIRLSYLGEEQVLDILKDLIGVPTLDMKEGVIRKDAQTMLPQDRMREMKVVPIEVKNKTAVVAFADPLNYLAVEKVKFILNCDVTPVLATQYQVSDILDHLDRVGYGVKQVALSTVRRSVSTTAVTEMTPQNIIKLLNEPGSTDLHLSLGTAPALRVGGSFKRLNMPIITPGMMYEFVKEVLPDELNQELDEKKEVEFTYLKPGVGRFRMNVYYQKGGEIAVAMKKLVEDIPSVASLGLPDSLISLLDKRGLLVVSSARGQGKDTTIAALVDRINSTRSCNIITFEDPIEYVHHHRLSNVNQRELGRDTGKDLSEVFDRVMKHDPDVLVMSNVKDRYMMETAVLASLKGILVIVGLNAVDVFSAVEQIVSTLADDYMKALFARSMLATFAQRLVWSKTAKKRVLAWESLMGTPRVQKYIRDDKVFFIKGQAPTLRGEYFPMEESLARQVKSGLITEDTLQLEPWIQQDALKAYMER